MKERTGGCLCGAVRFRALTGDEVNACHCTQCQRWTGGGPYYSVRAREVEVTGADRVIAYHASAWGERASCGTCGAILYWRMQGKPLSNLAAGALDDPSGLRVTSEIFVDYRPEWMAPYPGATQSTEAEEMAKLQQELAGE